MAATIVKGYTFGSTELVTSAKLHSLVDSATISGIVNAEISASAAIADSKLATISTAGKVSGAALTSLANIPAGAGVIPAANLPATGGVATELSFVNADLSSGVLTVTHSEGLAAGYTAIVTVVNNSGAVIIPDAINTFAANSFKVDLTSYGTLTGTWYCTYLVKG